MGSTRLGYTGGLLEVFKLLSQVDDLLSNPILSWDVGEKNSVPIVLHTDTHMYVFRYCLDFGWSVMRQVFSRL